jgi:hypothetical protein
MKSTRIVIPGGAGNDFTQFQRNNVDATRHVLNAMKANNVNYLVHISSSVVESVANDWYTDTKRASGPCLTEIRRLPRSSCHHWWRMMNLKCLTGRAYSALRPRPSTWL